MHSDQSSPGAAESPPKTGQPEFSGRRPTRHKRIAALIVLGAMALVAPVAWLTDWICAGRIAVPVAQGEQWQHKAEGDHVAAGSSAPTGGFALEVPQLDLAEPKLSDRLAAIAEVVASRAAVLDNPALSREMRPLGSEARGDGRAARQRDEQPDPSGRWEIQFPKGNTLQTYAKALDFFKIELGVVMPGNQVQYVYSLSKSRPDTRTGPADADKRCYLTWRRGELIQADQDLLSRAGIEPEGKILLKFLPAKAEALLARLESQHAGPKASQVEKTRFSIRPASDGYEFFVVEQTYK